MAWNIWHGGIHRSHCCIRGRGGIASHDREFAFTVWDREDRRLTLARDRIGERPLYYISRPDGFAFASELSALEGRLANRHDRHNISREGLDDLVMYGSTRGEHSIRAGARKLSPETFITVDAFRLGSVSAPCRYWSLGDVHAVAGRRRGLSDVEGVADIDEALIQAVTHQMVADVPLGAFLSGGIDSSPLVAKMVEESDNRIGTFSIGFESTDHDEASFARAMAERRGTNNIERSVCVADLLELAPTLLFVGGEPFANPSPLPTLLVCAVARD